MISRSALALAGALIAAGTLPAHAETNALAGAATKLPSESAGPGQLFPPLPSLASLPPSAAEQVEDAPAASVGRRAGKKGHKSASHKSAAEPIVRMVVSDESQAYLTQVDHKLDDILHAAVRSAHGGTDAVSVAASR